MLTAICFLLPAVFMWLYWFFIPAIKSMRLSFYNYSYITPERTEFVGFDNFVRLFHDKDFLKALQHTFLMVAVVVLLIAVLAFLIAVLLDGNLRGKTFFRTVYYMPYVISAVAVSIFFMYFFVKGGIGSRFFSLFGLKDTTWFTSTKYALFLVIIIYVWRR